MGLQNDQIHNGEVINDNKGWGSGKILPINGGT